MRAVSDTSAQTTKLFFGSDLAEADRRMVFWYRFTLEAYSDYRVIRRGFRESGADPVPFGIPMRLPVRIGEGNAQVDLEDRVRALIPLDDELFPIRRGHAMRLTFWLPEERDSEGNVIIERRIVTGFDWPMESWFNFPPAGGTYATIARAQRRIDVYGNTGYDRICNFYNGIPVETALRDAGIHGASLLGLEVEIEVGARPDPPYFFDPSILQIFKPEDFLSAEERHFLELMQYWQTLLPPRTQYDPPAVRGDQQDGFQPNPWPFTSIGRLFPPTANPDFKPFDFWAKRADGLIDPTSARLNIDGSIDTILLQTMTVETRYQRCLLYTSPSPRDS